jgi:spore germination protein KC
MAFSLLKGTVIFGLMLCLTGCWSRIEVNDRAFVTQVFVDVGDKPNEVKIALGIPLTNRLVSGKTGAGSGGNGKNPFTTVVQSGETIGIALRKIQSDMSREITWGHTRVIIFGEEMARRGIQPILEFASREPNFHSKTYLLVISGGAVELAQKLSTPVFERFPSEIFREKLQRHSILNTTVKDIMVAQSYGADGLIGRVTITQGVTPAEKEPIYWVHTDGAAVMKDGKMIGEFDLIDMRASMWIKGMMENAVISLDSPTDGKKISFKILRANAKVKPKVEGDKVRFEIKIDAVDDILSSDSDIRLQDVAVVQKLQQLLSQQLKLRLGHALEKSQSLGVDAFGMGQYLSWYYPSHWKRWKEEWRDIYSEQVTFDIEALIRVKRPGNVNQSYWNPD